MEDIRPYGNDPDDALRLDREDGAVQREAASSEDELPFEIPRD